MKKIVMLCIGFFLLNSCSHNIEEEKTANLIDQAVQYFQNGLEKENEDARDFFIKSALAYEKAIEDGNLDNGYMFYNTGNSWFMAGEIGKAIYYLRKAEKKLRGNDLVDYNLQQARMAVPFFIERKELNPMVRTLLFFHYDLNSRTKYFFLLALIVIIFSSASLLLFRKSRLVRNIMVFAIIFSVVFSVSLGGDILRRDEGVILSPVYGYKGDSKGYEKAFNEQLSSGVEFTVKEKRHSWLYIELNDGNECWIPETATIIID